MKTAFSWTSRSVEDTIAAGAALGRLVQPGAFLALFGGLGAGKTQFVKGLAKGLDVPNWDTVCSPTYVIAARYDGRMPLLHVDAYRLGGMEELEDLGEESWLCDHGATALEWSERASGFLPPDRIDIRMAHDSADSRHVDIAGHGLRSSGWVSTLKTEFAESRGKPRRK